MFEDKWWNFTTNIFCWRGGEFLWFIGDLFHHFLTVITRLKYSLIGGYFFLVTMGKLLSFLAKDEL